MDAIFKEVRNRKPVELTEEEKLEREKKLRQDKLKREYLAEFRVYPLAYIDSPIILTRFRDSEYNYIRDAWLAEKLVMDENKELPFDLRWRLLYYREQMEEF